ncbi:MAG TPA: formate/nitrite transporter family protein [Solirubrobacteraceae bacterium]|nr:formate/nitrite transporter family protein [Solirubrobacteraceae bacterium]
MSGRDPDQIWNESAEEGARRLNRGSSALVATGFVGGIDVMLGILALTVVTGALAVSLPEQIAHIGGSLVFGIGFVFIVVGRSELFTENFLVPVAGLLRGHSNAGGLARLWALTMVGNVVGLALLAAAFTRAGMVPPETLDAAGKLADTLANRDIVAAFLSAVVAGATMTLFTWLTEAVELDVSRILIALLIGFLLAAPSLNHAVVGIGEMAFGLFAGTTEKATWTDFAQNVPVAIVGNLVGGLGFVTVARLVQLRGEPAD